jgi:hypothetical protein
LVAYGRWFSQGTPGSFTTKTGRHDIAEILLKLALKHQKSIKSNPYIYYIVSYPCTNSIVSHHYTYFTVSYSNTYSIVSHHYTYFTLSYSNTYSIVSHLYTHYGGCCGRDPMVVGFSTTCAISAYHHQSCELESHSWWGVLDTLCYKVC